MREIVVLLVTAVGLSAQTGETTARPSFEVVSVKPTQGQQMNSGFRRASPGNLNATNVSVRFLIEYAYGVRDDQVAGGPSWLDSDRYEIVAKPPEGSDTSEAVKRLRTQSLLADRFHVAFHRQTKELPVFVLITAKNGPKGLHEASAGRTDFVNNGHHLSATRLSMQGFARDFLAPQIGRSVFDKTGIAGEFDFALDWAPDDAASETAPTLFIALQEQLGLKLEQQKGPVEVLVIDHAGRPTEN